jgi:hypothetical protein
MLFHVFGQRPLDQARLQSCPFGCRIRPLEGRGGRRALFKRIEEERGWVAGLRRPGEAFGGLEYPTVPLNPRPLTRSGPAWPLPGRGAAADDG